MVVGNAEIVVGEPAGQDPHPTQIRAVNEAGKASQCPYEGIMPSSFDRRPDGIIYLTNYDL